MNTYKWQKVLSDGSLGKLFIIFHAKLSFFFSSKNSILIYVGKKFYINLCTILGGETDFEDFWWAAAAVGEPRVQDSEETG